MKTLISKKFWKEVWSILWSIEYAPYRVEKDDLLEIGAMKASETVYVLEGATFRWDGWGFKYRLGNTAGRIDYKDQVFGLAMFLNIKRSFVIDAGDEASKFSRVIKAYYEIRNDEKRSN